jgi:hypothetical protein
MHTKFWVRKPEGKGSLGKRGVGKRIILILIFKKHGLRKWTGYIWFITRPSGGPCEHGNET